jgi:hypothetical protein
MREGVFGMHAHNPQIWRGLGYVGLLAIALAVSACSGLTASTGTPGCNKTNSGCYGIVYWTPTNTTFTGTPQGVGADIYVRDLTCDSDCIAENGYVADYLLLADSALKNWYEFGYWRGAGDGGALHYFSGTDTLGGGGVAFTDFGSGPSLYNYTLFGVDHAIDSYGNYVAVIAADPYGGWSTADFYMNTTSFTPGAIEAGVILHGTKGEAAEDSDWLGLRYETKPIYDYPLASMYPNLLTSASHGSIRQDQPPYAQWMGVYIDGDTFTAQCCVK